MKAVQLALILIASVSLAISLASSLGEVGSSATPAFADGALFPDTARDLDQPAQMAIIDYDDGRQDLILQVKYEGDADEFAWVIPVPSYPDVDVSDAERFRSLAELTAVWVEAGGDLFSCTIGDGGEKQLVDVWEEDTVGIYHYAVLSAEDPSALIDWLNTNGYIFPENGQEIIDHYIAKEWYFVAIKINPGEEAEGLAEGTIQPLKLSFNTDTMLYPLKITSLSSRKCEVLLYIIADQRVVPHNYRYLTLTTNDQVRFFKRKDDVFYLEYAKPYVQYSDDHYSRYIPSSEGDNYLTKMRANINDENMVDIELIGYEDGGYLDSDEDGWSDEEEATAGTDPDNVDTDGDGTRDPEDTYPVRGSGLSDWIFPIAGAILLVGFALWLIYRGSRRRTRTDDEGRD